MGPAVAEVEDVDELLTADEPVQPGRPIIQYVVVPVVVRVRFAEADSVTEVESV